MNQTPGKGLSNPPLAPKKTLRSAGGETWDDPSIDDWNPNDFRLFCGDLGSDVSEEVLKKAFSAYLSVQKIKVVRDAKTGKSKGYGFISFKNGKEYLRALKEMNGKFVGSRPIKTKKSTWKERQTGMQSVAS